MGVSKVVIDGEVKLDLTADTVEPAALKAGYTAHNAAGDEIVGTMPAISLEDVYPFGAIYISVVDINPSTLFGFGTWEQIKDVLQVCHHVQAAYLVEDIPHGQSVETAARRVIGAAGAPEGKVSFLHDVIVKEILPVILLDDIPDGSPVFEVKRLGLRPL